MIKKRLATVALISIVAGTVALAGCAPETASTASAENADVQVALEFEWSTESTCATCHGVEDGSFSDPTCAASLHTAMECLDCHDDVSGLQKAHEKVTAEDVDGASKLKKTEVSSGICLTCHDKDEEFVALTESSVALTDKQGKVVNPHDLPVFEDTGRGTHESVECSDCHAMHEAGDAAESASSACKSCHHQGTYASCYDAGCHETAA